MPHQLALATLALLILPASAVPQDTSSASAGAPKADAAASPSHGQSASDPAAVKKTKKVWTNDNLSSSNGTISLVGKTPVTDPPKANAAKPLEPTYVAAVRAQLQKLTMQVADTDKLIEQLSTFEKGESSGSSSLNTHRRPGQESIPAQIQKLREKKKNLETAIDALLDDARKKGIESGQLR